jgi:hypothetical protein
MSNPEYQGPLQSGSDPEAEKMFLEGEDFDLPTMEKISKTRETRGIYPDAQQRFDRLIAEKKWTRVDRIDSERRFPTLDQWVSYRIANGRGTKFYPCFIQDEDGNVNFLKVQITDMYNSAANISNEIKTIKLVQNLGFDTPQLIDSGEPSSDQVGFVVTKAVLFSEGMVVKPENWTEEHAQNVAEYIHKIETTRPEDFDLSGSIDLGGKISDLRNKSREVLPDELFQALSDFTDIPEVPSVFSHGDAAWKNFIIHKNGRVQAIDWELCGAGPIGHDAGKLLSNISVNQVAADAFLERYLVIDGKVDLTLLNGLCAGIIAENLIHIEWRIRRKLKEPKESEDAKQIARTEIQKHIESLDSVFKIYADYSQR